MRFLPPAPVLFASLLAAVTATSSIAADTSTYPPHTIANSELRVLPRTSDGRHYQLHIGLPASYRENPERRYPVVYVTDAYWDFQKITSIHGSLVYDRVVPEFITVGLGYAGENLDYGNLRRWELSPVPFGGNEKDSGQAAKFLQTIASEIIPFVEREYRADPSFRVLAGASLGGLFTLNALYTQPELFQGYVAATPAVLVAEDYLNQQEEAFARAGKPVSVRLYATAGGNEWPDFLSAILRFNARIADRAYPGMAYDFRIIDGERHAGMQLESYTRGLRFVFAPLAPESGPAVNR